MGKHLKADGRARGKTATAAVLSALRPVLTDIPGALAYLGDIGRSKFYSDLLQQLDVVRFGTRTFITIESLDKLIDANRQLKAKAEAEALITEIEAPVINDAGSDKDPARRRRHTAKTPTAAETPTPPAAG